MRYFLILIIIFISCKDNATSSGNNHEEDNDDATDSTYYDLTLNNTGQSHLVVFLDTIEGLSIGDEIGIFDLDGVTITDSTGISPQYGQVLVGTLIWDGEANEQGTVVEVATIMSEDLSNFDGPILNGAVDGNDIIVRVYDVSENLEYNTTPTFGVGGEFGDIFTTVITLLIEE